MKAIGLTEYESGKRLIDLDLTGDQFGRAPVQIATVGRLYRGTRVRRPRQLLPETLTRCEKLEQRARLNNGVQRSIDRSAHAAKIVSTKK